MPAARSQSSLKPRWRTAASILLGLALLTALWQWGVPRYALWQAKGEASAQAYIAALQWYPAATRSNTPDAHFLRARLARKLGQYDVMARALQRAAEQGADRRQVELELLLAEAQRGRLAPLEAELGKLLAEGRDPAEVCEAFVQGCLLKYRLDDALQMLELWEADYPRDARPHMLRGRILEHRVDLVGAKQELEQALRKNPRYGAAAYNLARILVTEHRAKEALPWFRVATDSLGNRRPGLIGQAQCRRMMGEFAEARQLLEQAQAAPNEYLQAAFRIAGEPLGSAAAKLSLELGLLAADQVDYESAVPHLTAAIDANPNDWRNRYQLGMALRHVGKAEEAARHLAIVEETNRAMAGCDNLITKLQHNPSDVEARFEIGQTFLRYLSENQGLVWLNSVLDYDPNHRRTHEVLEEYFRTHGGERPEFAELAQKHREQLAALPQPDEKSD